MKCMSISQNYEAISKVNKNRSIWNLIIINNFYKQNQIIQQVSCQSSEPTLSWAASNPGRSPPSDRIHVIFGAGTPVAEHSRLWEWPTSSCNTATFLLVIVGGT
jgi:hypothetical protein